MNSERKLQIEYQQKQIDRLLWRCCVNCEYFKSKTIAFIGHQEETEMQCTFYTPHQQPPMSVIMVGCENHLDGIPF